MEACRAEGRCLVTLDLDFGNPLLFKPSELSAAMDETNVRLLGSQCMGAFGSTRMSRRQFIAGAGASATALALGLSYLRPWQGEPTATGGGDARPPLQPPAYRDWTDVYRERWRWDRVVKGTHTRANCISACSWNLFVKDGMVWRRHRRDDPRLVVGGRRHADGGYGHIHYRMFYGSPGHAPRGAPVEVERVA